MVEGQPPAQKPLPSRKWLTTAVKQQRLSSITFKRVRVRVLVCSCCMHTHLCSSIQHGNCHNCLQLLEGQRALGGGARVELGPRRRRLAALLAALDVICLSCIAVLVVLLGMTVGLLPVCMAVGMLAAVCAVHIDRRVLAIAQRSAGLRDADIPAQKATVTTQYGHQQRVFLLGTNNCIIRAHETLVNLCESYMHLISAARLTSALRMRRFEDQCESQSHLISATRPSAAATFSSTSSSGTVPPGLSAGSACDHQDPITVSNDDLE